MPLKPEDLRKKLAAARLTAKLAADLDPDYAEMVAATRADAVEFTDDGDVDPASLDTVVRDVLQKAPAKFRLPEADRRGGNGTGADFYADLRAAVARRHGNGAAPGVATLADRLGLPRGAA